MTQFIASLISQYWSQFSRPYWSNGRAYGTAVVRSSVRRRPSLFVTDVLWLSGKL